MRIENITDKTLKNLLDDELSHLRSRCLNIFDRYFALSDVQKAVGMDRRWFLTKYLLLRSEMENRGIKLFRERPLDKEVHNRIFKTSFWKLDVPALGDMVAIPNYVSVCGEFIKSPVTAEKIDVVIRTAKEHRNEVFEAKIGELVKEQTNKEPNFIYEPKGPGRTFIPLFDLVLKSHDETRKVKMAKEIKKKEIAIKKPEESETTIRIPVGPDCEVTATITIDKGQGIQALYCGKIKKVRTYLFDKRVKAWTMASARAWIKEHSAKAEKAVEKNASVVKKKAKTNTEKGTIFKIIKINKVERLAGGIVYEPETEDTQGDLASKEEIEKALTSFMKRYATDTKRIKINHKGKRYFFPIIESFIPEEDIVKGGDVIPAGSWWLMIHISNDKIWKMVENKELEGFSMGGRSKAKP